MQCIILGRRAALTYGYSAYRVGNNFHGGEGWYLGKIHDLLDFLGLLIASSQAQVVCHIQQIGIHSRLIFLTLTCHQDCAVFFPSLPFHMAVDLIPVFVMRALQNGFGGYSWLSGIIPRRHACSLVDAVRCSWKLVSAGVTFGNWNLQQICSPCLRACLGYTESVGLKLGESYLSCAQLCIGVFPVEWFLVSSVI